MVEVPKKELPNIANDFLSGQARERSLQIALSNPEIFFRGPITLSSGQKSDWYFDARYLNLLPEGAYWTGMALVTLIKEHFPTTRYIGGSGLDGHLAVGVILSCSWGLHQEKLLSKPFWGFSVDNGQIGGYCGDTNNLLVEGAATTGASILKEIKHLTSQGKQIEGVVAIMDRGGSRRIQQAGYKFVSLFRPKDLGIED